MTVSNDGNLTPPERPDPCYVCGEPVSYPFNEFRDKHDGCTEGDDA